MGPAAAARTPQSVAEVLRPQIEGKTKESHDALFGAVYPHHPHNYSGDPSIKRSPERDVYALYVRTPKWKYTLYTQGLNEKNNRYIAMSRSLCDPLRRLKGQEELFDINADPYEQNDVSAEAVHRERVATFRKQALDWWTRVGGGPLEVAAHNRVKQSVPVSRTEPRREEGFFNGKDLTGWKAKDTSFWSVKDGALAGTAGDDAIKGGQFLWYKTPVSDFHLSLKVKHAPYSANEGIQFRSAQTANGAHGYQADVGEGWWGTLFHEHGRRILARSADAKKEHIKREDWNHYEILAVGQRIWLAINGKVTVALRDKFGELEGHVAMQIHGGAPQTVAYKELSLTHNPKIELAGMDEAALNKLLVDAPQQGESPRGLTLGTAPGGIQALIKQLDLNADRKKKLAEFNEANRETMAAVRKLKGDERRAAMKKINEARNAKLEEVLTVEQATKLKELQAKARADNKKQKEAEAPPTAVPPKEDAKPRPPRRKNQGGNTPKATGKPKTKDAAENKTPNIVIIFADDLGYGDLGCFGGGDKAVKTPNIDRLAKEGMKFTDWLSLAPICAPSRAALLTGRYPMRCGLRVCPPMPAKRVDLAFEQDVGLSTEEFAIPRILKPLGYSTAMFGKSHFGNDVSKFHPMNYGFDTYFGVIPNVAARGLLLDERREVGMVRYQDVHQMLTDRTTSFMEQAKADGKPFMIYLSQYLVHGPHLPNDRFIEGGKDANRSNTVLYQAVIRELDWDVGEVMTALKRLELDENTIIFFISDNGPTSRGSAHPLRGGKADTTEGGPRVPAIVRWPGVIKGGGVSEELCGTFDVFATIAEIAGAELPADRKIDGQSLVKILKGAPSAKGHEVFYYYDGLTLEVVRKGKWKLHLPREGVNRVWWAAKRQKQFFNLERPALFNLENDIGEQKDVANDYPEVVTELLALAEGSRKELGDFDTLGSDQRPVSYEGNANNPPRRK